MFAKKSLGQHFLNDPRALRRIADAAHIAPTDVVLEVGPGEGALTALLVGRAGRVVAVEKDARLIPHLQKRFSAEIASGKLRLIHGDILTAFHPTLLLPPLGGGRGRGSVVSDFPTYKYKLVANLPYYITGQFLRKFLQTETQPQTVVLLLQKEVARRIVAPDGKESIISISVKCYGAPRVVGVVKAGAFSPPPKVDSAILTIENISKEFFKTINSQETNHPLSYLPLNQGGEAPSLTRGEGVVEKESKFFSLLKKGFAHPRKLLSSNLGIPVSILRGCGIAANARAENVSLDQWKCLGVSFYDDPSIGIVCACEGSVVHARPT